MNKQTVRLNHYIYDAIEELAVHSGAPFEEIVELLGRSAFSKEQAEALLNAHIEDTETDYP